MSAEQDSVRRLAEIRKRVDDATIGPWVVSGREGHYDVDMPDDPRGGFAHIYNEGTLCDEDAEFIAHAREDVPYLLSLIDSLTTERDDLLLDMRATLVGKVKAEARAEAAEAERDHKDESYERAMRWLAIAIKDRRAAEADRERLRGALELIAGGESLDAAGCARVARAALATPPSEGQS